MEADESDEDARPARRALWIFRLVFLPVVLFVAVLLLVHRLDTSPPGTSAHAGTTDQGNRVFTVDEDDGFPVFDLDSDAPISIDTTGWSSCSDGGAWYWHFVGDARSDAFAFHGDRLHVLQRRSWRYGAMTSRATFVLDATFDGDRLRGHLSHREEFEPSGAPKFECSAEEVAFSVQR